MQATIEKVSKFGVMIDGDWKNLSKFHKGVSLDGINAGDVVEIELQKDKYITALELVEAGNGSQQQSSAPAPDSQAKSAVSKAGQFRTQEEIIRQEALNAVLSSPWLGEFYKAMDYSEAVSSAMTLAAKAVEFVKAVN